MSKKIYYIHHGYMPGGAPVSLKYTVKGIKERNPDWDIEIHCIHKTMMSFFEELDDVHVAKYPKSCLTIGRLLIGWSSIFYVRSILFLCRDLLILPYSLIRQYRILKKSKVDFVHLNSSVLMLTAFCARLAGIKVVWHIREVLLGGKYSLRKKIASAIIKQFATKIICISPIEAKSLGKNNGKINVVYNFIDFEKFNYDNINILDTKKKYGLNNDNNIILSLGGVAPRKGTVQLIEAMDYLPDNYSLIIAGPVYRLVRNNFKSFKLKLENILIKTGLKSTYMTEYPYRVFEILKKGKNKNIIFTGVLSKVAPLLAISDLLVFAGTTPHFPRPVFEAWAMEKPVAVFKMDGVSNQIEHCKNGIVIEKINGKKLAESIVNMFTDKNNMKLMGKNGKKKSLDMFDINKNINEIQHIYNHLSKTK